LFFVAFSLFLRGNFEIENLGFQNLIADTTEGKAIATKKTRQRRRQQRRGFIKEEEDNK
tara:strand:- start:488 stop:664 length:177 start_codon:yes stop_codon:yes gene_type:complete